MKTTKDIIGNKTRDIPGCTAVPQTTVPPVPNDRNTTIIGTRNLKHEQGRNNIR